MTIDREGTCASLDKRAKELAHLLGIQESEPADVSLSGRLKIVQRLKAARRVEIARGRTGSWLYDVNRHLNLCAALRQECEALAAFFPERAGEDSEPGVSPPSAP